LAVVLHGLGADHTQAFGFTPPADELGSDFTRVAVDMRGHGATDALGALDTLTYPSFTDDLIAVVDQMLATNLPRRLSLIGMSMGAELALRVAHRRPELVTNIVLIRPARPDGNSEVDMSAIYRKIHDLLTSAGPDAQDLFLASAEYRSVAQLSEASARSLRGQFDRPRAAERAGVLLGISQDEGLSRGQLATVTCPALILVSPGDPAHPMRCGRILADTLPNAGRPVIVPQKRIVPTSHNIAVRRHTAEFLLTHFGESTLPRRHPTHPDPVAES
jgi:pimeloyl-ACP methyl ester carboxylesterase